ncbi:MAG TPA: ribonuclease HII [Terrimesophilobacter sp.]|nr:ribonuclease HII [Terrimesophilobacter sp.]
MPTDPTLDVERDLLAGGARWVIGCDEVGRGAIAGPVAVGVCAIDQSHTLVPAGLRDSKLLSERVRTAMAPAAAQWSHSTAVGLTGADEIDRTGIIAALGAAGVRALATLFESGVDPRDAVILLDGTHDWLSPVLRTPLRVVVRAKADRDCASVAAASVIAKVHRDTLMIAAHTEHPEYGWASNKGYGAAAHLDAIDRLGPAPLHRRTWLRPRLPMPSAEFSVNA